MFRSYNYRIGALVVSPRGSVGIATGLELIPPFLFEDSKDSKYLFQDLFLFLSLPKYLLSRYESIVFNIIKRVKPPFSIVLLRDLSSRAE